MLADILAIAFLLDNGIEYHIAHSVALLEHIIITIFFPNAKRWQYITPIGASLQIYFKRDQLRVL